MNTSMDAEQGLTELKKIEQAITEAQAQVDEAMKPLEAAREEDAGLAAHIAGMDRGLTAATTAEDIRQGLAEIERISGERNIMGRLVSNLEAEVRRREGVVTELQGIRGQILDEAARMKSIITNRTAEIERQEQQYEAELEALENRRRSIEVLKNQVQMAQQKVKALTGEVVGGRPQHGGGN